MSAPGWTQTTGGHHLCAQCGTFAQATVQTPVWRHYADNKTATMTVCAACAKAAS